MGQLTEAKGVEIELRKESINIFIPKIEEEIFIYPGCVELSYEILDKICSMKEEIDKEKDKNKS